MACPKRYNTLEFMHGVDDGDADADAEGDEAVCDATAIKPYKLRKLAHKGCVFRAALTFFLGLHKEEMFYHTRASLVETPHIHLLRHCTFFPCRRIRRSVLICAGRPLPGRRCR